MDYTAMNAANTALGASVNGFVEPLHFAAMSAPMIKGPDWFSAEDSANPPCGLAIELRFQGARRIQTIESQT